MKNTFTALLIILTASIGHAQIEVGLNTLPDVGDVLYYDMFTHTGDTTSYRMDGPDLNWSYDNFIVDSSAVETYLDIAGTALGDSFPNANMILEQFGSQAAARRTTTKIEVLGFAGGPLGFLGNGTVRFEDPLLFRQVPINYGDQFDDEVQFDFVLDASLLPGLDSLMLPIPGATVDSLKIGFILGQAQEATAWGNLSIMGSNFEVLKMTQINTVDNILELGINVAGTLLWIDATPFLGNAFGGRQVTKNYQFLSADHKEVILEFSEEEIPIDTMGNTQLVITGRYAAFLLANTTDHAVSEDLEVMPNPAVSHFTVSSESDATIEAYKVIDAYGRVVLADQSQPSQVDISNLAPGRYAVLVQTNKGLGQKALIVQK